MTEFKVNSYINNSQSNSTVAIDTNGNFVISWQSFGQDESSSNGIYAQGYNSAGVAVGTEFRVNSTTSGNQFNPTIAMDADGDFVISWTGQDASGNGIYAQLYKNNGVPPTITSGSASALAYTENATTAIDSGITVSDADSLNLASATVSITSAP
ncbi:hypothetical protein [Nostoc sp. LPT]|uniref:hypothetical protein n=1 Tax=Nostoc sp. LPT TaxID=2815387 RepID=UPI001DE71425|nr:hypothetical protein [Nostoc sp. LPT]MBN4006436.1 hypothetical protein [Nostoc sp. LPT]